MSPLTTTGLDFQYSCGACPPQTMPRRIEALTGERALVHVQRQEWEIRALAARLKTAPDQLDERVERILREYADQIKERLTSGVAVLAGRSEGKAMLICVVSPDLTDRVQAGRIIAQLSPMLGGKGGGRPDMAQGGGSMPEKLAEALDAVPDMVQKMLGG